VLRFFAPRIGLAEDPVTGSVHSSLVPYWAARLGRTELRAIQLSHRGGEIHCSDQAEAVIIAGRAVIYLEGSIEIPDEMTGR
jgi:predicted PhzF superfamily epimerase YddE/YHI9